MAVVGEAYVVIRALPTKFKGDIEKILRDAKPSIDAAGKDLGDSFARTFRDSFNKGFGDTFDGIKDQLSDISNQVDSLFADRGTGMFDSVQQQLTQISGQMDDVFRDRGGDGIFPQLSNEAETFAQILETVEVGLDDVDKKTSDGGGKSGGKFDFLTKGAEAASARLQSLLNVSDVLGPAIAGAVGAVAALAESLFALGAAAAQAGPALAVLPVLASAAAQAFSAVAIGAGGVGKAISAGLKQANQGAVAAGSSARQALSSARAIENAQRSVRDAYQRAADSAYDSAKRVADAQDRVVDANRKVRSAQEDLTRAQQRAVDVQGQLNRAYEEAAERLQQLGFDAEDAVLAEERALLRLAEAQAEAAAAQNLPADDAARKEAELSYKEAELNYRRAKDRTADITKLQEEEAAKGVEGSKEVVDAKGEIVDAQNDVVDAQNEVIESLEGVRDAEEAVNEALRDQKRAARDAAEGILDAQRNLQYAQQSAALATNASTTAANNYNDAMKNLSPSAKAFVEQIISMRGVMLGLRGDIADGLFPPITKALQALVDTGFFKILSTGLTETGKILGSVAGQFLSLFTQPIFQDTFATILGNNNTIIQNLGSAFVNLAQVVLRLLEAAGPLTIEFSKWILTLTEGWRVTSEGEGFVGRMTDKFEHAGNVAKILGGILKQVWDVLANLGKAAAPAGFILLDALSKGLEKLNEEIVKATDDGSLGQFFIDAAENTIAIVDVLGDFARVVASFGDNKEIKEAANALKPLAPVMKDVGDALISATPQLSALATQVGNIIKPFADSKSTEVFLSTLTRIAEIVANIVNNPIVAGFIAAVAPVLAVWRALKLVKTLVMFLGKATLGPLINSAKNLGGALGGATAGKGKHRATGVGVGDDVADGTAQGLKTGSAKVATAATQMAQSAIAAAKKRLGIKSPSTVFMAIGRQIAEGMVLGINGAKARIATAGAAAGQAAAGAASRVRAVPVAAGGAALNAAPVGKLAGSMGALSKVGGAASMAMRGLGAAFRFAMGPLGLILIAVELLLPVIKNLWENNETFRNVVTKVWNAVKGAIEAVWNFLKPVFEAFVGFFKSLWEGAQTLWDNMIPVWDGIKKAIEFVWNAVKTYFEFWIGFYTKLWEGLQAAWDIIKGIFQAVVDFVVGYYTTLFNAGKALWSWFSDLFQAAWDIVVGIWNGVVGFISEQIANIAAGGAIIWNWFSEKFQEAWNFVVGIWNGVWAFIEERIENLKKNASYIWNWFIDKLREVWGFVTGIWNGVWAFIQQRIENLKKNASYVWNFFIDKLREIWAAVQGVWNGVWGWISGKIENLKANASKMWNFFSEKLTEAWNNVKATWNTVLGWVGGLKDQIANKARGIWDGLTSGIRSALNFLIDAWNRLDFGINVSIPSWVPFIGGKGFRVDDIIPDIPRLATGGIAQATSGGQIALLAEAGRNERIEPLDSNGMSKRDYALLAAIKNMRGKGDDNIEVRVFIGDQELRGIIGHEVKRRDDITKRAITYVRDGVYSR